MGRAIERFTTRNLVHSVVLIISMMALSAVLGWMVAGVVGLIGLAVVGVTVLLAGPRVAPSLILRMYGARRISDYEAPQLIHLLRGLSREAGLHRVPEMANAFTVGGREKGAIAVTDGLLRNFTLREMQGVLAHELSHLTNNDGFVMSLADSFNQMVNTMSWVGQLLLIFNLPLFLMGAYQVPWLLIFVLIFAPTFSALLQLALSRTREFEADLEAARLTGDPRGLASALAKLHKLSDNWFERLFLPGRGVPEPSLLRTHPLTEQRIQRLLEIESDMAREHEEGQEDWIGDFLSSRAPILAQPRWRMNRFWY